MKFRTEYQAEKAPFSFDPKKPVVLLGSCFAQNMAAKMSVYGMQPCLPAGTLYNPDSIATAVEIMGDTENSSQRFKDSLFLSNGLWNSWGFDSSFSSPIRDNCIKEFEIRRDEFLNAIEKGQQVIVTFGTSICYYIEEGYKPVGNCHKQPGNKFFTRPLSLYQITDSWNELLQKWKVRYPDLKVIFTVSPVRHLKDGFVANSRSKAVLQLAVEEICRNNPAAGYFPAYEILNDDLRDYRFYASDLAHPSEEAIEYIWEKFVETYFDTDGKKELEEGLREYKAAHHRPKTGALGLPLHP